ncbi:MAG: SLBB domain-containing protein [Candidatus Cloacimonetes bacterium]|nr:SLBB domain-containing protein [Candidatus Cloacimonadota bacterium]
MNSRINLVLISIIFMMFFSVLFAINANSESIEDIQAKVASGEMSQYEAIEKAKELGFSNSQIRDLAEQYYQNEEAEQFTSDDFELNSTDEDNATYEENCTDEEEITDDNEEINSNINETIDIEEGYFGYGVFQGASTKFTPSKVGTVDPNYQVGPGDEITISLWGDTELYYEKVVSREGTIKINNVGQIIVNGLTLQGLENKIKKRMSKAYASINPPSGNPTTFIDVSLGKLKPITVFIVGEAKNVGSLQIDSYSTAFTALYYSGGSTIQGSLRDVQVIRNGEVIASIDLYNYLISGKKNRDIRLQNDDTIFIPHRISTITLKGEVNCPSIFELKKDETLNDLLKFAAGVKTTADVNRVQIERIVPFDQRIKTDSNLTSNLEVIDVPLMNKDSFEIASFTLFDEDIITVFPLLDEQLGYVSINGAIYRSGKYELEENMTISRLIEKAQGYLPDVYLTKAELTRSHRNGNVEFMAIDLTSDITNDLILQDLDSLNVYSIWDLVEREFVNISGHVKLPGKYDLQDNMMLSDLLFKTSGFNDKHFWKRTYQKSGELIRINSETLESEVIRFNLKALVEGDSTCDIRLIHQDYIIIRKAPEFEPQEFTTIEGSVFYPGKYFIKKDETLSNLIARAGGFKDDAFIEGINFSRKGLKVVGDYRKALSGNKNFDVTLTDGDSIYVPNHPGVVIVNGLVNNPGIVKYQKGWSVYDYIEAAGGYHLNADKSEVTVYYPSGNAKQRCFFSTPKVTEGANIVVPKDRPKEDINWTNAIKEWASILASTVTTIFIIAAK